MSLGAAVIDIGLALMAGIILVEIFLRLFRLAPSVGIATVSRRQFAELPGIYEPFQRLTDTRNPAIPWQVSINGLGYRGPELPRAKEPREIRILIVGDSFTFGDFVDDDQTFPVQLERRLREAGVNARTINAGLGAATIIEQAEMAQRGLALSPDLVVLQFSENDVSELSLNPTLWEQLAANREAKARLPLLITYPFLRRTALWYFFLMARGRSRAARLIKVVGVPSEDDQNEVRQELRARYRDRLRAFSALIRNAGIPFVFIACPSHLSIDPTEGEQMAWVVGTARELGLHTVDMLARIRASGLPLESLYLLPRDGHPTPQGHALAAETLAGELLGSPGLLQGSVETRGVPNTYAVESSGSGRRSDQRRM